MFAAIGAWLLSKATSKLVGDIFTRLARSDEGNIKLAEINATSAAAMKAEDTAQLAITTTAGTERQKVKMNQPVFWIIIAVMMGPPAIMLWGVTIYNFLFWEHGIWPQTWAIADFPPGIKPWVEASIQWLYDPYGPPATVAAAGAASWFTGRR